MAAFFRSLPTQHCVRRVQQVDGMHGSRTGVRTSKPGADLHQAARVSCRNPIRACGRDVPKLRGEHRVGCCGLEQVVDAGGTAALLGISERN
jgi:hypothetical protein